MLYCCSACPMAFSMIRMGIETVKEASSIAPVARAHSCVLTVSVMALAQASMLASRIRRQTSNGSNERVAFKFTVFRQSPQPLGVATGDADIVNGFDCQAVRQRAWRWPA